MGGAGLHGWLAIKRIVVIPIAASPIVIVEGMVLTCRAPRAVLRIVHTDHRSVAESVVANQSGPIACGHFLSSRTPRRGQMVVGPAGWDGPT